MSTNRELEIRERLTRHWLAAEPAVRAYVAAAVRSFQDREDLVQQIALTVARRFEEFDPNRPFLGWVLWLAKSRITDYYRSQGRQRVMLTAGILDQLAETLVQRQATISPQRVALDHCLEKLPARSRHLIQLRYVDGLNITQVANAIRSTPGSVRVTLFRIRDALADCIRRRLASEGATG